MEIGENRRQNENKIRFYEERGVKGKIRVVSFISCLFSFIDLLSSAPNIMLTGALTHMCLKSYKPFYYRFFKSETGAESSKNFWHL